VKSPAGFGLAGAGAFKPGVALAGVVCPTAIGWATGAGLLDGGTDMPAEELGVGVASTVCAGLGVGVVTTLGFGVVAVSVTAGWAGATEG